MRHDHTGLLRQIATARVKPREPGCRDESARKHMRLTVIRGR